MTVFRGLFLRCSGAPHVPFLKEPYIAIIPWYSQHD